MQKRFSIFNKFVIVFGLLILTIGIALAVVAIRLSRKAVIENVETYLLDKAVDTAEIINQRLIVLFQFIDGLSRAPTLYDPNATMLQKLQYLKVEAQKHPIIETFALCDANGIASVLDGDTFKTINTQDRSWYQLTVKGHRTVSQPNVSRETKKLQIRFNIPLYDDNQKVIGVLSAAADGQMLSDLINDIVIGKTGSCYIIGQTGTTIAAINSDLVKNQNNNIEKSKTDASFSTIAAFEKQALSASAPMTGYFYKDKEHEIAAFAKIEETGWTVIIQAPYKEFLGTVDTLRLSMIGIGLIILLIAFAVVYIITKQMMRPIKKTIRALKNIAQGEGDLTVRLPVTGNDEITDLSEYFNETIAKIGASIQQVGVNSHIMEGIGSELASNMIETASAVHQINANIDGVKQKALTQASSVTETATTVEEIVRTIKQLNASIETQAASVAQSFSSVEQMVLNITSIGQTLSKTDSAIKDLTTATGDGKATLITSNTVTQKIAEESGSLLEASSVIQHIASQTNLLAMNAAIEAAHAGEAGKGFAVVADEIRKLAEDSAMQGKTITATLKALSGEIETLSTSSKTVEEKFNAIFTLAEQVKEMSAHLTEAIQQQESGSKEVLNAIKTINTVTVEVQADSEEMLKGGESVAAEMHKLDSLTRVITKSMNEMSAGALQINQAVQEVNEITQKNKRSIEVLAHEVAKFKV
ncbi:MAG: methyl-accepting chemotaxis protein [Treponema sp.]|uniref:methyl-accepting chemotaxis protein n=1 Tax=Treponema sp. TaxID=166 RepID=UPI003FA277E4